MSTVQALIDELAKRRGNWRSISDETALTYTWLVKFANGRFREPGWSKIQRLQSYFAEHPRAGDCRDVG